MPARTRIFGPAGVGAAALILAYPAPTQVIAPAAVPVGSAVAAFYETYRTQPLWFRGGVDNPAVAQLIAILQRAPFDGFGAGPQLAIQAQAAAAQAHSGNAADVAAVGGSVVNGVTDTSRMSPRPNAFSQQRGCNMSRPSSGPRRA